MIQATHGYVESTEKRSDAYPNQREARMSDLPEAVQNVLLYVGGFTSIMIMCITALAFIGFLVEGLGRLKKWWDARLSKLEGGADE